MSIAIFLLAVDDWLSSQLLFGPWKLIFKIFFWVSILSCHISHVKGNNLGCQMLSQNLSLTSLSLSPNVGLFDTSPWLYIIYFCLDFNKVNNIALHINFKLFCVQIFFKIGYLILGVYIISNSSNFQGYLQQICHIVLGLSFGWELKKIVRQV